MALSFRDSCFIFSYSCSHLLAHFLSSNQSYMSHSQLLGHVQKKILIITFIFLELRSILPCKYPWAGITDLELLTLTIRPTMQVKIRISNIILGWKKQYTPGEKQRQCCHQISNFQIFWGGCGRQSQNIMPCCVWGWICRVDKMIFNQTQYNKQYKQFWEERRIWITDREGGTED